MTLYTNLSAKYSEPVYYSDPVTVIVNGKEMTDSFKLYNGSLTVGKVTFGNCKSILWTTADEKDWKKLVRKGIKSIVVDDMGTITEVEVM